MQRVVQKKRLSEEDIDDLKYWSVKTPEKDYQQSKYSESNI